jgi:hypothetical protein
MNTDLLNVSLRLKGNGVALSRNSPARCSLSWCSFFARAGCLGFDKAHLVQILPGFSREQPSLPHLFLAGIFFHKHEQPDHRFTNSVTNLFTQDLVRSDHNVERRNANRSIK